MMRLALALTLSVAAPTLAEEPDRLAPRFRGAVSLVGAAGHAFPSSTFSAAPGLSAEAGVVFSDFVSVVARGTFATILSRSVVHGGVSFDVLFGERVSLGLGVALSMLGAFIGEGLPSSVGVSLPVRVSWMFRDRAEGERARSGFYVFGEAAPGVVTSNGFGLPVPRIAPRPNPGLPFLLSAVIGIGYGAW